MRIQITDTTRLPDDLAPVLLLYDRFDTNYLVRERQPSVETHKFGAEFVALKKQLKKPFPYDTPFFNGSKLKYVWAINLFIVA